MNWNSCQFPLPPNLMMWCPAGEAGALSYLAQESGKLKEDPRKGGAVASLAATPVSEASQQSSNKEHGLQSSCLDLANMKTNVATAFLPPSKFHAKMSVVAHLN